MHESQFTFPMDCLPGVGEVFGNQYALPPGCTISGVPAVLDIGANCGAFTFWARLMWSGCRVTAYEPQPDIFRFLEQNLAAIPNTVAINAAVGDPALTQVWRGRDSRLCSGQYDIGEQQSVSIPVRVIHPSELPFADIVKIDTEGAEGFIVEHLPFTPAALLLEWHGADNRRRVELAVRDRMKLVTTRTVALDRGVYCYVKP